jgi:hypothetical protein
MTEMFECGMRNAECGLRPVGAIGAYPPACKPPAYKPTGWKRPRREDWKKLNIEHRTSNIE